MHIANFEKYSMAEIRSPKKGSDKCRQPNIEKYYMAKTGNPNQNRHMATT